VGATPTGRPRGGSTCSRYVAAKQLVTEIYAAQATNVNAFAGVLEVIADANLSGTRFFVLADPGRLPQYIWGHVSGEPQPLVAVRLGWETDDVQTKTRVDVGFAAIEYRAGCTGTG
jgi:hypothetical protein